MKEKTAISPSSAKLWSTIYVKALFPKKKQRSETVGLALTPAQAAELAAMLLSVAYARNGSGDIYVTGKKSDLSVSVIRKKNGSHALLGRKKGNERK